MHNPHLFPTEPNWPNLANKPNKKSDSIKG